MLAGPDLILSYVYTDGGILTDLSAQTAHQLAGMNAGRHGGKLCFQLLSTALLQIFDPLSCVCLRLQRQQLDQNIFNVAYHRHIGGNVLADLGRIHIHVDGLGTTADLYGI